MSFLCVLNRRPATNPAAVALAPKPSFDLSSDNNELQNSRSSSLDDLTLQGDYYLPLQHHLRSNTLPSSSSSHYQSHLAAAGAGSSSKQMSQATANGDQPPPLEEDKMKRPGSAPDLKTSPIRSVLRSSMDRGGAKRSKRKSLESRSVL